MKICYIAHPIGAATELEIRANLEDLRRIIRFINQMLPDVTPFCPYYADVVSMDDNVTAERHRGIKNNRAILQSGIVHELWMTGSEISSGMIAEGELAIEMGIKIIDLTNQI